MIKKIFNIIVWIVLIIMLVYAFKFYNENNFNDFVRSEAKLNTSEFRRDKQVKYSKKASYEISQTEFNDATFLKTINVEKNKPYRVTCMIKTENVIPEVENKSGVGAQIAIVGTTERSIAISGTNEWKKVEMIFNSKNREQVDIGFRLGGYLGNCTGKAWFSDFKLEEGTLETGNTWKFACFIFKNTDVKLDKKEIKLSMTNEDFSDIKDTISRFEKTCQVMSNNKMNAKCDVYEVDTPINTLTYDNEFGYYVAPEDVEESIKDTIDKNNYDHIFVIIRLGNDEFKNDIQVNDWIGLGYMDYYGIGYSNIRLPNSSKSYIYKYDTKVNTFPEEVFLHEFLHSLERTATEYGYEIPALHDNKKYGYITQKLSGLKNWYYDYMNKEIKTSNGNIGLPNEVYNLKPAKISNFKYSYEFKEFSEPENIVQEFKQLVKNLVRNVKQIINGGQKTLITNEIN